MIDISEIKEKYDPNSILVCLASAKESQNKIERYHSNIIYTGIGKVNATLKLSESIHKAKKPVRLIINFGIAGSAYLQPSTLVNCTKFSQFDFDLTALNFRIGEVPFEKNEPQASIIKLDDLIQKPLLSGDQFLNHRNTQFDFDVVDMEGYALAKTADYYQIDFLCIKYISDTYKQNNTINWKETLKDASDCFAQLAKILFE